jgi:hypothetical protein
VHGQAEARIDADAHVAKYQLTVARRAHPDRGLVPDSLSQRIFGRHVNVSQGTNHALVDADASGRPFQSDARRAVKITGLADRRVNAELELFGHGDFHLRVLADRAKDADAIDPALGADQGHLFLAGKLAGLGEVALTGELMPRAEQRLDVFLLAAAGPSATASHG